MDDGVALATPSGNCTQCGAKSKYRCPNCQALTCSFPCYKSHGETCLEDFYKGQVLEHLKLEGKMKDKEKKKTVLEALQRTHEIQSQHLDITDALTGATNDPSSASDQRIVEEIELSDEDVETVEGSSDKKVEGKRKVQITRSEQQEFMKALKEGKLSLPLWHPWWVPPLIEEAAPKTIAETRRLRVQEEERIEQEKPRVAGPQATEDDRQRQELEQALEQEKERKKQESWSLLWTLKRPSPITEIRDDGAPAKSWPESGLIGEFIPPLPNEHNGPKTPTEGLKAITQTKPSSLLPYNLVDLLNSYVFTLRLYNGEVDWALDEVVEACISHSQVLSTTFQTAQQSLQRLQTKSQKKGLKFEAYPNIRSVVTHCIKINREQEQSGPNQSSQSLNESRGLAPLRDVVQCLYFKTLAIRALSHLYSLLTNLLKSQQVSGSGENEDLPSRQQTAITLVSKKVYYYIVWLLDWSSEDSILFADALWAEYGYWRKTGESL